MLTDIVSTSFTEFDVTPPLFMSSAVKTVEAPESFITMQQSFMTQKKGARQSD
jgi:hypothetical protein